MNEKSTNPKDACGIARVPMSTVPWRVAAACPTRIHSFVIGEIGLAMLEGSRKYGRHNYREAGVRVSVYIDAAWRHLFLRFRDLREDIDPDSGIHHVTKALACLFVLADSLMEGNCEDDRPPSTGMVPDTDVLDKPIVTECLDYVDKVLLQGAWDGGAPLLPALLDCICVLSDLRYRLAIEEICDCRGEPDLRPSCVDELNAQAKRIVETVRPGDAVPAFTQLGREAKRSKPIESTAALDAHETATDACVAKIDQAKGQASWEPLLGSIERGELDPDAEYQVVETGAIGLLHTTYSGQHLRLVNEGSPDAHHMTPMGFHVWVQRVK